MKKRKQTALDLEIDKLINSIENALTGEVFDTVITLLSRSDTKKIRKTDWVYQQSKYQSQSQLLHYYVRH